MSNPTIGFIGLGIMGKPMTRHQNSPVNPKETN
jgi:NAD binding domain of 6-phosphogluconate dehydrogenase